MSLLVAMGRRSAIQSHLQIIQANPIGQELDEFRDCYSSAYEDRASEGNVRKSPARLLANASRNKTYPTRSNKYPTKPACLSLTALGVR